jgi:TP901 family phage tail tape measure protein
MSDFSVTVGGDFSELLQGFKLVERSAQQSGQAAGQALGGGIQGAVNRSIDALLADLGRLKAQKAAVNVDGGQVIVLNQQISAVQKQIDTLRSARVAVQADPRSIEGLNAKLAGLQSELGKVAIGSQRFRELQTAIGATEKELAKAGQSTGGLRALDGVVQGIAFSLANTLTNAAAAALQGLAAIPQQVRQFDSAKAAVRTLGVDADDLGNRLLKLSASTKGNVSAVDLLKASYDVASSGFASAADATNILSAAQDGAVGGFTDINTVADAATSVLNAYGLSSDKARKLIDGFIQTQNDGKITVGQYATEIGRIAPVAAASGVSIEELNAAISVATAQGVPVGSTFAGLRQAISSILKPSVEASTYAKQLGLDFSASALKAKGFGGLLTEVAKRTGGSADAIIKLTGSVEAQAAIQPLVNDQLAKYNQFLRNQAGAAGVAARSAEQATNTIDGSLKRLGNTFSNLAVQAFEGLAPPVTAVINAFNNVVNVALNLPGPVRAVAGALVALTSAYVGARTAAALFTAVLQTQQVQELIGFFRSIASTIKQDFQRAIVAAKVEWQVFTTAVRSQGLLSAIGGIGKALLGLAGQVAVVALRFAYIAAAVEAYQKITGAASEASEGYKERLLETQKALDAVSGSTENASEANKALAQNSNGVIKFFENLPIALRLIAAPLEGVIRLFYSAVDNFSKANALGTISDQSQQLQAKFTEVQQAAQKTFVELKNATTLTPEQAKSVQERIASLQSIKEAATGQAAAYRELAASYRAAGNNDLAKIAEQNAKNMEVEASVSGRLIVALQGVADRTNKTTGAKVENIAKTKEQVDAIEKQKKAEDELNKILASAPVRNLEAQLAVGQQLLGLTKAVGDLEQSRFNVTRSALQFELKGLEERGAGESAIAAKKAEIDRVDRAALSARYQALVQQQALERQMLLLSQEKARTEANLQILEQKAKILEAQANLAKATTAEEKAAAQAQVNLQNQILGVVEQKAGTLAKTQPIERAIAAAAGETARNGLQAEAAAKGFKIAADGSLVASRNLSSGMERVAVFSGQSAQEQERFRGIAQQAGLAIGRAADGSLVLGRNQQDVARAVQSTNAELGKTKGGYDAGTRAAGGTKTATDQLRQSLVNAGVAADDVAELIGDSGSSARDARGSTDALRNSLAQGKTPAGDIANAFVSTGKNAPAAAQGARDFAAFLSSAKVFAERIASLNLAGGMTAVRDRTREAAVEAQRFYDWLLKASNLPGSRWTGGPVEAGAEYKINELGQEAFLSAGRLSLINAPQNAIWRAPSSGVVVPAGITARLQDAGALPSAGGMAAPGGTAELAVEIGKLRQEVGELARRQWNINVTQRTGVSGSQVLRTLQQLR